MKKKVSISRAIQKLKHLKSKFEITKFKKFKKCNLCNNRLSLFSFKKKLNFILFINV